jgi:hypothetical protein
MNALGGEVRKDALHAGSLNKNAVMLTGHVAALSARHRDGTSSDPLV